MKTSLAFATALAVVLVAPNAFPCGAPFGNGINADPQQDIIVVHKAGIETYVFKPRFCGSASEFGLIVPIPSKLSAAPALADADAFTDLATLSAPKVVQATRCSNRSNDSGGTWSGAAGGSGQSKATLVSSGTVGFMDYAQLEAGSVSALTAWLDTNGFPHDSLASATFNYYVDKGWLFLAFKVSQGVQAGQDLCKDLGPVSFSFATAEPVVPTRMATARAYDSRIPYTTGFSWHVYGVTDGGKQIGFAGGQNIRRVINFSGTAHTNSTSHLAGLVADGDRLTKLTITFDYGSDDPDVAFARTGIEDYQEVVTQYTYVPCDANGKPIDDSASFGGGCSMSTIAGGHAASVALAALLLALRRRRRT